MSSRIENSKAEGAEVERLFAELAQMEPVSGDLQVFSGDETQQLRGLLARLLGQINKALE
jgi:hypothetical protein